MSKITQNGVHPRVLRLTEGAVMLALATVLSLVKLVDLPYGGSVTAASAVPLVLLAFRHGVGFGTFAGLAYGLLQLAFSSSLSYVTGFWSVTAVLVLDFIVAFAAVGLGGVFRRVKNQSLALTYGAVLYGVVRYILHVIAGATVWAGISIPTAAALIYSIGYNATYMIPETVITAAGAYFLGSVLDFRGDIPTRLSVSRTRGAGWLAALTIGAPIAAVIYDVVAIFPHVQDPETGAFTFAGLTDVRWSVVGIVTGVGLAVMIIAACIARTKNKKEA
ncbi:MAG: hypothetical protein E7552_03915 [Ruminococcaceae bacterium]|nr:hypothetical protein [Oscillospiraceae bacterium]